MGKDKYLKSILTPFLISNQKNLQYINKAKNIGITLDIECKNPEEIYFL
jgi:hypothetical protein